MLKTVIRFTIPNIVNLFLGVLSAVILTRALSPNIYGVLNIFNTMVATGLSILYMGLDSSFIRFYNEPPHNESSKELGTKLLFICLLLTLISACLFSGFMYKDFSNYIFGFESRIIVIMVFVSILAQIIIRFLNIKYRMEFNTKQFAVQSILAQVVYKFAVIIAVVLSLGINGIVSFSSCCMLVFSCIYILIQRNSFFSFESGYAFRGYRDVFVFAIFSAPLPVCININMSLMQQMISHLLNVYAVGVYSSASYFAGVLAALQGGFATFWSAYMYRNYRKKQNEIKRVNECLLLAIIIIYAFLILGKDVVYLIIGNEYQASKQFFSLVLSYPIFMLAAETTTYGIGIMKKNQYSLICFILSMFINLGTAYFLIPILELKGAAIATFLSGIFLYISRSIIGQMLYKSISNMRITIFDIVIIVFMALIPAFLSEILANVMILFLLIMTLLINREILSFFKMYMYH